MTHPLDEKITPEWVIESFPATSGQGKRYQGANYDGKFGSISWQGAIGEPSFVIWLNGRVLPYKDMDRLQLIKICHAIELPIPNDV